MQLPKVSWLWSSDTRVKQEIYLHSIIISVQSNIDWIPDILKYNFVLCCYSNRGGKINKFKEKNDASAHQKPNKLSTASSAN